MGEGVGLALIATRKGAAEYTRVGLATRIPIEWCEKGEAREIVII
jgi:hypothetical protein